MLRSTPSSESDRYEDATRQQHALYGKEIVRKAEKRTRSGGSESEDEEISSPDARATTPLPRRGFGYCEEDGASSAPPTPQAKAPWWPVYGEHGEMIVMEVMGQELQESTGRIFQVNQWWNFTAKDEAICPAVRNALTGMFIGDERKLLMFTRHLSGPKLQQHGEALIRKKDVTRESCRELCQSHNLELKNRSEEQIHTIFDRLMTSDEDTLYERPEEPETAASAALEVPSDNEGEMYIDIPLTSPGLSIWEG
ncbi:hypothetical protein HDU89_004961 [Geranomyces variabilis]|nr:hypothetical protein HDU89_004961 [Geranomyces variabilis]